MSFCVITDGVVIQWFPALTLTIHWFCHRVKLNFLKKGLKIQSTVMVSLVIQHLPQERSKRFKRKMELSSVVKACGVVVSLVLKPNRLTWAEGYWNRTTHNKLELQHHFKLYFFTHPTLTGYPVNSWICLTSSWRYIVAFILSLTFLSTGFRYRLSSWIGIANCLQYSLLSVAGMNFAYWLCLRATSLHLVSMKTKLDQSILTQPLFRFSSYFSSWSLSHTVDSTPSLSIPPC